MTLACERTCCAVKDSPTSSNRVQARHRLHVGRKFPSVDARNRFLTAYSARQPPPKNAGSHDLCRPRSVRCAAAAPNLMFAIPTVSLEAAQTFVSESPLPVVWYAAAAFLAANGAILAAAASASFKLILLIASVSWMVSSGRLPENTAPVLSKVGFALIIPCMLMSKVASTLTVEASLAMAGIPLAALLQICVGALFGWLAASFVQGDYSEDLRVFGYHPKDPNPAAAAIAASTAAAMSLPQMAPQLVPKAKPPPRGFRELVQLSCAFGNSLTLPLVFIYSLLPEASAGTAVAFVALFIAGWSPCLWSIGYEIMGACCQPATSDATTRPQGGGASAASGLTYSQSKPSFASDAGSISTIDVTDMHPAVSDQEKQPGFVQKMGSQVAQLVDRYINPPLVGVIAGVVIGLSPMAKFLLQPSAPFVQTAMASYSLELTAIIHIARAAMDVVAMLGSATLAVQAIVLAASMVPKTSASGSATDSEQGMQGASGTWARRRATWQRLLIPSDPLEKRCLGAVFVVRMVLMPIAGIGIVTGLAALGMLPADPLCKFVILLQSAMPTAQNLVLLLQLREETQELASDLALLLLRLYLLAIVPLSMWVILFMSLCGLA